MEVLGTFGINPILLVAQIVNFLIIFYIVKRFALKPILQLLKNRENAIKTGLTQAEEARLLLEKTAEKEKEVLKKAQLAAKELLDETRKQTGEMLAVSEERTRKQTDIMLADAKKQIEAETREAEKQLSKHVSELAIHLLEKSTHELFTEKEQGSIMQRALKTVKNKID